MLDFPASPNVGDTWTGSNGVDYVWDGTKWVAAGIPGGSGAFATRPYVDSRIVSVLDHGATGNGITDDTAAILNVLNAYAGRAVVFIPDTGQPYMVSPLTVPSGTDLLLHGTLMLRPNSTNGVLFLNGVDDITIRGHGIVDGNGAAQTAISAGINADQCDNISVSGITLQNAFAWNFNVTRSTRVRLFGAKMLGGGNSSEFANGCDDCWITNCTVDGPTTDMGFAFYGGVTNSGAVGNTVRNSSLGIFVLADAGQPAPCRNIVISDNVVYRNFSSGIASDSNSGAIHQSVVIANNRIYENNTSAQTTQSSIWVDHTNGIVISDNLISSGDTGAFATGRGIGVGNNATHSAITGNVIENIGSAAEAGTGIFVTAADFTACVGNTFHDFRQPPFMTSSIGGIAGVLNYLVANNTVGLPITIAPQPDTVIQGVPRVNAVDDAAAAAAGVPVGNEYRNGSQLMVRVA